MTHTQVLVVGGSVVGLSAAVFLAAQGVDVVVAERHEGTSPHPRARGLNPRTMELFREHGLDAALRELPSARALVDNSGIAMCDSLSGTDRTPSGQAVPTEPVEHTTVAGPIGWCLCDQDQVEPVLAERARELGAQIRFGTEVTGLRLDADGVEAQLNGEAVTADYVVAADGASSTLRTAWGIGTHGPGALSRSMSIHFRADLRAALGDRRFVLCYIGNDQVRGALAPIDNAYRWMLHVPFSADSGQSPADFTPARCRELIAAAIGDDAVDIEVLGSLPWTAASLVADTFRRGRGFLVGDAAHVMPPTGAFGSNTGIQDAHNLAWRLAVALRGSAGPGVLDGYDRERRPVADATAAQAVLRSRGRPGARPSDAAGPVRTPIVADDVVALGYRYRTSTGDTGDLWNRTDIVVPGARLPHVWVRTTSTRADADPMSSLDLVRGNAVIISAADDLAWATTAAAVAAHLGMPVDHVGITPERADRALLPAGVCAVAVRPDGFVAWCADGSEDPCDPLLSAQLCDQIIGSPTPMKSAAV